MTTRDYANDCDVCGADRRFCDCQQGRTSVFSDRSRTGVKMLLGEDHLCAKRYCVPLHCLPDCPCRCHKEASE